MTNDPYAALELAPHPEGGAFREIYRSATTVLRGEDDRAALTVIHFRLRAGERSRWHVVASDELWQFTDGAPLELLDYDPDRETVRRVRLGVFGTGDTPVHVVPAGHWQAAQSLGDQTLVTCAVGPGFDFADFAFVCDRSEHAAAFAGPLREWAELL